MPVSIAKVLSNNDVGTTGSHQAGMCVPRSGDVRSFFPPLDENVLNPRAVVVVREAVSSTRWEFNFIYYNNRRFGGTRNEYRLTGMTAYLRAVGAKAGDVVEMWRTSGESILVELKRGSSSPAVGDNDDVLVLGSEWVCIKR